MLLAESLLGTNAASGPVYIEDVFSTYLYTGNSGTQTITNGIDLSTKGGMVWIKSRQQTDGSTSPIGEHGLWDTLRGAGTSGTANKAISSNAASAEGLGWTDADYISSFGTNGFTVQNSGGTTTHRIANHAFQNYASWTFRKQAKFFDVVTYTGTGSARTVAHNLGSTPGVIICKKTSNISDWVMYHRSVGATAALKLNQTYASDVDASYWNNTAPTDSVFTVKSDDATNANGATYVAYLFAHDAGGFGATGADNVISCGSYTGNGGTQTVTLGYEPQWVLIKNSDGGASGVLNWNIIDNMRGMPVGSNDSVLNPNTTDAETSSQRVAPTATGFTIGTATGNLNDNGAVYIYIAIRRGPMKTPTTGSTVYGAVNRTATGAAATVNAGRVVDLSISARNTTSNGNANIVFDRMRGLNNYILTTQTSAESTGGVTDLLNSFANQTGVVLGADSTYGYINSGGMGSVINWYFTRAPGVFDIVAYTGTGANRTVSHNLGVPPEFMIVKGRSGTTAWQVYSSALANTEYLVLNTTAAKATGATRWNSTTPTSSVFSLGTATEVNTSTATYIAYLFASCPGVSKVGSYTGTGAVQTIDCGFTAGARFLLIKRTDSTSDWYLWDSTRGIVSGNDPYLRLNLPNAPVTTTDWVDPASSGFALSDAVGNLVNTSSATYTFLAIA